jgi:threonine/homoserine/homoserine lactone efflux protein
MNIREIAKDFGAGLGTIVACLVFVLGLVFGLPWLISHYPSLFVALGVAFILFIVWGYGHALRS